LHSGCGPESHNEFSRFHCRSSGEAWVYSLTFKEIFLKESLEENIIVLEAAFGVVFGIILGAVIDNVGLGSALGSTIHKEDSLSEEE